MDEKIMCEGQYQDGGNEQNCPFKNVVELISL